MENLIIKQGKDTPGINFNAKSGAFEITGRSLPEDVTSFYDQIISWLEKYNANPAANTVLDMKMQYFNTASSKMLLDMLFRFEELAGKGNKVLVKWYYESSDTDMKDAGEEYAEIVEVPFEFIVT